MERADAYAGTDDFKTGQCLCAFYNHLEEYQESFIPLIKRSLEQEEKTLCLVDELSIDLVLADLQADGVDIDGYLDRGQLKLVKVDSKYLEQGFFDPDKMAAYLRAETRQALAEGYTALRLVCEMAWVLDGLPSPESLKEYQDRLERFLSVHPCSVVCLYHRRRFDPTLLLNILTSHPLVVVGGEILENFYYLPAGSVPDARTSARMLDKCLDHLASGKRTEQALIKARSDLENRVAERTAELSAANEELKREIQERHKAQAAAARRETILRAVAAASEKFLRETELNAEGIQEVLASLGQAAGVSRVYVFENRFGADDVHLTSQRHEWTAPGIISQINNPDLHDFPWQAGGMGRWEKILEAGRLIQGQVRDLPPSERAILEPQGIISILVVPIFVRGRWWGFMGFDECLTERDWSAVEVDALKTAGAILGALIERKLTEEVLRENEQKYRTLVDTTSHGISEIDLSGTITFANSAHHRILGFNDRELIGLSALDLIPTDQERRFFQNSLKKLNEDRPKTAPWFGRLRTRDGRIIDVQVDWDYKYDAQGSLTGLICVVTDITERKKAEAALRESEAHLRSLMENAVDFVVYRLAADERNDYLARVVFVSPSIREIVGVEDPMNFETWFAMVHPDDLDRVVEANRRGFETFKFNEEVRVYNPVKKEWRWIQAVTTAVPDELGRPKYANGIMLDITDRIKAQEALRQSEETANALLNASTEMMMLLDINMNILAVNDPVAQNLGLSKEDLVGRRAFDFFSSELTRIRQQNIREAVTAGRPAPWEDQWSGRFYFHNVYPIFDDKGQVVRLAVFTRDNTQQRQAEEQVRSYQERLRRMGSELLLTEERERRRIATDLHDHIGQSLAITKIRLKSLQAGLSGPQAQAAEEVCRLVEEMIKQVRSLTFELSPPILYELGLEAAVEWLTEQTEEKYNLPVAFETDRRPKMVEDDVRISLFRGVRELLFNVVKHAQAPRAKVTIRQDQDRIMIEVWDEGLGFSNLDQQINTDKKNFGLFSLRERLEALGGDFFIVSEPGRGTRAVMTAPLKREI